MSESIKNTVAVQHDFSATTPLPVFGSRRPILTDEEVATVTAIRKSEDQSIATLCRIAGLDITRDFFAANLKGASFANAGTFFENANFKKTHLMDTVWDDTASLKGINLEGANLTGATGLTEEKLAQAYISETTILPEGMDRDRILELHQLYLSQETDPASSPPVEPSPAP